jgi:hypothetical protein
MIAKLMTISASQLRESVWFARLAAIVKRSGERCSVVNKGLSSDETLQAFLDSIFP